jgi:uncharacterized protein YbjT (DUF2867 family)
VKVTVFGATGQIGYHVVTALLADGDDVTAYVRNPGKHQNVDPRLAVVIGSCPTLSAFGMRCTGRTR